MLAKLKLLRGRKLPLLIAVGAVVYAVLGAALGYHDANRALDIAGQALGAFLIGGGS